MKRKLLAAAGYILVAALFVATMIAGGCSPKKNTAASRNYQAFITRYNIYFNGDQHFRETLADLEKDYQDDYSALLYMHPAEAHAHEDAEQPTGDFTRSIEKAQKAIQLRSIKKRPAKKSGKQDAEYKAWLKRDEYNPFLHNAWMMMGRSQYFNGDFLGAASTFFYVSRHFTWLPTTVTEAKLWQARSYLALDWLFEAETIITRIKQDELTDKTLKELYNFVYADFYLRSHDYEKAVEPLKEATDMASGAQRIRLTFLLGQLYQRLGRTAEAYETFAKAAKNNSASYRTRFNARIKQSEVFGGEDVTSEVKALQRMVRYDRNAEYLDQIYYAIGNLYLSRGDTAQAITNYELALEKSKRNAIDKAIAGLTLGSIYFDRHSYDKAQRCYSEAVTLIPESYPNYEQLQRRSNVLDELAIYAQNVELQDSLLRLSAMTPEQQLAVVNKIIEDLKKKEKEAEEAAKREEYLAMASAAGNGLQQGQSQAPSTFVQNNDKSWYFYNTATRNSGKTEFQKKWGSRKLEDNWRRRNKSSFNFDEFGTGGDGSANPDDPDYNSESDGEEADEPTKEQLQHETDPHYPEYYLKQIPATDADRATSNDVVQEGLYNMGVILKDKLEDFPAAKVEFDRLLERYPDNTYRLDTYYNLYLMAIRSGNKAEAARWQRLIVNDFPESSLGVAMRDPEYFENLARMEQQQEELYARTYDDYLNNRNASVHAAYDKMQADFPMSKIMPKFMFLHALAYVTEDKPDEFNATLRTLLERYPETDITPLASAYLRGMAQGRKLHAGASNMRGMVWNMRMSNDSAKVEMPEESLKFDFAPDAPMELVLLFPTDSVSANQLLFEVARFNFNSFTVRDFDLELLRFGTLGVIEIKEFANQAELDHYRRLMAAPTGLALPKGVIPVMISVANMKELLRTGASFEQYFKACEEAGIEAYDKYAGTLTTTEPEPEPTSEREVEIEPTPTEHAEELAPTAEQTVKAEQPEPPQTPQPMVIPPTPPTPPRAPSKIKTPSTVPTTPVPTGSEGDEDDDDTNPLYNF